MDLLEYIRDLFSYQTSDASNTWPDDSPSRGLWDTTSIYYSACHPPTEDSIGRASITSIEFPSSFANMGWD